MRTSVAVPNDEGHPSQIIAVVEDITERKHVEDALRAAEERFRIAAENASDMIYEWDLRTGQEDVFGPAHQRPGDWPTPLSYEAGKGSVHPQDLQRVVPEFTRYI